MKKVKQTLVMVVALMILIPMVVFAKGQSPELEGGMEPVSNEDLEVFYEFSLEDIYPELAKKAKERDSKPVEFHVNNKLVSLPAHGPQILQEIPEGSYFKEDFLAELLIPASYIRDGFGYQLVWKPATQAIELNDGEIKAYIGKKDVKVGNRTLVIDNAPVIRDGRTYVKLDFIKNVLGWTYTYDSSGSAQKYTFTKLDRPPAITDAILKENNKSADYAPLDVSIYGHIPSDFEENPETIHWVGWDKLGSNTQNVTLREKGTPFKKDLEYLNSLVGRYGYGFAGDGQLTIGDEDTHLHTHMGHSSTAVAIEYIPNKDYRCVSILRWIPKTKLDSKQSDIVQQNLAIEAIKYMSKSIEDGHAIIAYIDKHITKNQYPTANKDMTFGSTKVRFEKISYSSGFNVIFKD